MNFLDYYDSISSEEADAIAGDEIGGTDNLIREIEKSYGDVVISNLIAKPEYEDILDAYFFVFLCNDNGDEFLGYWAGDRLYDVTDEVIGLLEEAGM